jgi:hypothetical protein
MRRLQALTFTGAVLALLIVAEASGVGGSLQFSKTGDTITITGFTNLAPGDRLLVNVVSAAFTPTEKGDATGFSGAAGAVVVRPGSPLNTYRFDVDVSSFSPGLYLVSVESVETRFRDQGQFVLPWTPVPTVTVSAAATATLPTATTPLQVLPPVQAPQPTPTEAPLPVVFPAVAAGAAGLVLLWHRGG